MNHPDLDTPRPPSAEQTRGAAEDEDARAVDLEARRLRLRARRQERSSRTPTDPVVAPPEAPPLAAPRPRSDRRRERAPREVASARETAVSENRTNEARRAPRWAQGSGLAPEMHRIHLDATRIDDSAARVVTRLTKAGHEAYLVGGCVRDLLVGCSPKDFDVATSASPEEVRALFRNSRIIGRRFRLVHVLFGGGHIVETATFRKNPPPTDGDEEESLLIRSDNVFGEAHEDALRRDFTINALFYDLAEGAVLDWTGGMQHIEARTVHTIGDPMVRFQEDPIRILRAIKFAARLDFGISQEVYDAAVQCRGALAMAARPRLSEEILRLMRGGAAHRSIWLAYEMGMLDVLLPELSAFVADSGHAPWIWALLSEVDARTKRQGAPLDDVLLWSTLLLEPMLEACDDSSDRLRAAYEFVEPVIERLSLPRRIADGVSRIIAILPRYEAGRAARFKKSSLYPLVVELNQLRKAARSRAVD